MYSYRNSVNYFRASSKVHFRSCSKDSFRKSKLTILIINFTKDFFRKSSIRRNSARDFLEISLWIPSNISSMISLENFSWIPSKISFGIFNRKSLQILLQITLTISSRHLPRFLSVVLSKISSEIPLKNFQMNMYFRNLSSGCFRNSS